MGKKKKVREYRERGEAVWCECEFSLQLGS